MEEIRRAAEELRQQYSSTREGHIPVDIIDLIELDVGLTVEPFPNLERDFQMSAALMADFSGIYVDESAYMELSRPATIRRLRFTLAHELGHFVLHKEKIPEGIVNGESPFWDWISSYQKQGKHLEAEADEFAGRLLVPVVRLTEFYDQYRSAFTGSARDFNSSRGAFCRAAGEKFGLNSEVISIRLSEEGIWPVS